VLTTTRPGLGALAFAFANEGEAVQWVDTYYDIIKSEECVPLGHTVNANIAVVTSFSLHESRSEAIRRGYDGFGFFRYAVGSLVARDTTPGRTTLWTDYETQRGDGVERAVRAAEAAGDDYSGGLGTPDDVRRHLEGLEEIGVDQVIFLQQGGRNRHEHICDSLELFASDVMPAFKERGTEREARKAEELAPFVEAALARKQWMRALEDDEIPVVLASVQAPQVSSLDTAVAPE